MPTAPFQRKDQKNSTKNTPVPVHFFGAQKIKKMEVISKKNFLIVMPRKKNYS